MISDSQVQFYDHELRALKHPWISKVKKWLEYDCIVVRSNDRAQCLPLLGYNTRTYEIVRGANFTWACNCQGFGKRANCSHVEALKLKLKFMAVPGAAQKEMF